MAFLRNSELKVILSDGGTLSDQTEAVRTWGAPALSVEWVASDHALYLGHPHKFNHRYIRMKSPNAAGARLSASYWNGKAWVDFTDLCDETAGLSVSGFLTWEERPEWQAAKPSVVTGLESLPGKQELFWVRLKLDLDSAAAIEVEAVKSLLSDDRLMETIFPGILNYLPSGVSSLTFHEAAKDAIVSDLKVRNLIVREEQLKNPEDWVLAATYRAIELILDPIAGDDRIDKVRDRMAAKARECMKTASGSIDSNQNEVLDQHEKAAQVRVWQTR